MLIPKHSPVFILIAQEFNKAHPSRAQIFHFSPPSGFPQIFLQSPSSLPSSPSCPLKSGDDWIRKPVNFFLTLHLPRDVHFKTNKHEDKIRISCRLLLVHNQYLLRQV